MTPQRQVTRAIQGMAICGLVLLVMGQNCALFPFTPGPDGPVGGTLAVEAGPDGAITIGSSYTLQGAVTGGTLPYVYSWTPATGLDNAALLQPTFTSIQSETVVFTLTVNDGAGQVASDTATVVVGTADASGGGGGSPAPLAVDVGNDLAATIGFPITLQGFVSGGDENYTISWSPATSLVNPTTLTPTFTPMRAGDFQFTLTVVDGSGTTASASLTVTASERTTLSELKWGENYSGGGYKVLAEFARPLDEATAEEEQNYRISGTGEVPSTATLIGTEDRIVSLVFTGVTLARQDASFDISVDGGVKDANGNSVPQDIGRRPIANGNDTTAPVVSTLQWAVDYAGSYAVELVFSEAMDRTSVEEPRAYKIHEEGDQVVAFTATLGEDAMTVALVFEGLALSDDATIDIGLLSIRDINGQALTLVLAESVDANTADVNEPTIDADSIQFVGGFSGGGYQVRLEFNEAMNKRTVEEDPSVYEIDGQEAASATLANDGRTATLWFDRGTANTNSKLDIDGGEVEDINGEVLPDQTNLDILPPSATGAPPNAPTLTWLRGDVSTGYEFRARFNEAMDETTVEDADNWQIQVGGATIHPTGVVLSNTTAGDEIAGRTATVTFGDTTMARTTRVVVSVGGSILDVNGNALPQMSLEVRANLDDTTPPTVVSPVGTLPARPMWGRLTSGAYPPGDSEFYHVSVVFSETMDANSATNRENYWLAGSNPTAVTLENTGTIVELTFETTIAGIRTSDPLRIYSTVRDINGRPTTNVIGMLISPNYYETATPVAPEIREIFWGINKAPYQVNVVFSEVMDAGSATNPNAYTLGASAPQAVALSPDGKTAMLSFGNTTFAPLVDMLDVADWPAPAAPKDINGQAFAGQIVPLPPMPEQRPTVDDDGPVLLSAVWAADHPSQYQVLATFNEALDDTYAGTAGCYEMESGGFPPLPVAATTANLLPGGFQVLLDFNNLFNRNSTLDIVTVPGLPPISILDMHDDNNICTSSVNVLANPADTYANVYVDFFGLPTADAMWSADFAGGGYELSVTFSHEVLDQQSAETLAHYGIFGTLINPVQAVLAPADDLANSIFAGRTVTLTFASTPGLPYLTRGLSAFQDLLDVSLSASVSDVNGNFMPQILGVFIMPNFNDVTPPTVVLATATGPDVTVMFSEAMDRTTAETRAAYTLTAIDPVTGLLVPVIDPVTLLPVAPTVVVLQPDGMTVLMQFAMPPAGYNLRVSVGDSITDINSLAKTEEDFPL